MSQPFIIDATVRAVRSLPGWRQLRVLDLSCGDGQVIATLTQEGCKAEGTQFREDDYVYDKPSPVLKEATIYKDVDLCKPLPFPDAEYDVAIATEVLEHLPTHVSITSEVGRILKKGGRFIFTIPDIHRLSSRILFMMTGQHSLIGGRLHWGVAREDLYSTHFNPVYFPVMHTVLHHIQIHVERLVLTTWKPSHWILSILYPAACIGTWLEMRHVTRRSRACGRYLLRWMLDPRMLFSEQLMVITRKSNKRIERNE